MRYCLQFDQIKSGDSLWLKVTQDLRKNMEFLTLPDNVRAI